MILQKNMHSLKRITVGNTVWEWILEYERTKRFFKNGRNNDEKL